MSWSFTEAPKAANDPAPLLDMQRMWSKVRYSTKLFPYFVEGWMRWCEHHWDIEAAGKKALFGESDQHPESLHLTSHEKTRERQAPPPLSQLGVASKNQTKPNQIKTTTNLRSLACGPYSQLLFPAENETILTVVYMSRCWWVWDGRGWMVYLESTFAQDSGGLCKVNSIEGRPPATRGSEGVMRPTRAVIAHINETVGEMLPAIWVLKDP